MEYPQDEETEEMLGEIITKGSDVVASFLNDTDGLEGQGSEEEGYDYDGSGDPMTALVQEEVDRHDGSGDRTESDQVYILVKPVLTS